jgi:beta-glucosidase
MKTSHLKPLLLSLIAAAALPMTARAQSTTPTYLDETQPLEARIDDALGRMTLAEKVALCHAQSKFSTPGVPRLGIPELRYSDGPHGVRAEVEWNTWKYAGWNNDSCTAFPALTCLAATFDPTMAQRYGEAIGEEARYRRKSVLLGPGVNIYRTPLNGRNFEYMGEDPYLSSVMCVPYIRGVQSRGVACCVKHFALNNQELHRWKTNVEVSDRALYEIYLPAFKAAVQQGGAWSVMGAYNCYQGQHCCHNRRLLTEILKGEWGFDGAVVSDWGGVHDTRQAALYGMDLEMGTSTNGLTEDGTVTYDGYYLAAPYLALLQSGELPASTLDDKCRRILRLIYRTEMDRTAPYGSLASPEHAATCRAIGTAGIVLLRNEKVRPSLASMPPSDPTGQTGRRLALPPPARLLPLNEKRNRRILVVGDNATRSLTQGGGSSELKVKHEVSPLEALCERYGDQITYAQGYAAGKASYGKVHPVPQALQDSLRAAAVAAAREADVVLFVGGLNKNHHQDCEDGDRESLALPFGQDSLIEALLEVNPRVIVALLSGNAVAMPWAERVPAIVQGWYLGSECGHALVDILSGDVNPSGRLPFTFPARLEDCGAHAFDTLCYPGTGEHEIYREDLMVGYRWADSHATQPLFAFGYGLSYTTFEYGSATLAATEFTQADTLVVTVPVTNTGSRLGAEVVQLYVGDDEAPVVRPVKELKAFRKVTLAPGETQDVTLRVAAADLAYYDDLSACWRAEPGTFTLYVAAAANDVRQQLSARLTEGFTRGK